MYLNEILHFILNASFLHKNKSLHLKDFKNIDFATSQDCEKSKNLKNICKFQNNSKNTHNAIKYSANLHGKDCNNAQKNRISHNIFGNKNTFNNALDNQKSTQKIIFRIYFLCAFFILALIFWLPLFLSINKIYALHIICVIFLFCTFAFLYIKKRTNLNLYFFTFIFLCVIINSVLHQNYAFLVSIFYIFSIYIFIFLHKKYSFIFGFFVGLIGLYWMPFSFRFFDITFLIPFVILAIAIFYGIVFYIFMFFNHALFRVFTIIVLSFFHPMGFNWLNINYFSAFSIFSPTLFGMICITLSFYFIQSANNCEDKNFTKFGILQKILPFILIFISLDFNYFSIKNTLKNDIFLANTHVPQDIKMDMQSMQKYINIDFDIINNAILENKKMVVLPESSLPLDLLNSKDFYDALVNLSRKITIVVGAFRRESNSPYFYNTSFIFDNGKVKYIDKVELVPFGEKAPFDFLVPILHNFGFDFYFLAGKKYERFYDEKTQTFFSNAICYEASNFKVYKEYAQKSNIFDNLEFGILRNKNANFMIAISNNAWFSPSLQSHYQKMIMKYYARHYNYFIFHASNVTKSYMISPNNGFKDD